VSSDQERPFRDHLHIFGPAILITLLGFILTYQFVDPAPPDHIRIATGSKDGAYYLFALKYREALAKEGIDLEILPTAGSLENIELLQRGQVDIAFVQGGLAGQNKDAQALASLGSFYYEPLWLFHRLEPPPARLTDLRGRRIAVGQPGSGTSALAGALLSDNRLTAETAQLLPIGGQEAIDRLIGGRLDAAFFVASPRSPVVEKLLLSDNIGLMSFQRAAAYTRRHHFLSRVTLPQGVVDLARDIPGQEISLLATTANMVARTDLHPALIDLLVYSGQQIHGGGGWFEASGRFPTPDYADFPLSQEARHFYQRGPSFLQRYLPFWAATLLDRMKVMLLPLVALMIPLTKIMPPLYRWRIRSRIYPWYRDVLAIDRRAAQHDLDLEQALQDLSAIEREVAKVSVPLSFAEELYDLRLHISLARERLEKIRKNALKRADSPAS
jgi:TRAP transporter TAXI family solute receptor